MQFKVPQDVQRADKILGPLNVIQLAVMIGAALLIWLFYSILQTALAIPLIIIVAMLALAIAFLKIHQWPFPTFVRALTVFLLKPRVRTWQKMVDTIIIPLDQIVEIQYKKMKIQNQIKAKAKDVKQVDDLANLLDKEGDVNNQLPPEVAHLDEVDDDKMLQAAYYGSEHDLKKQESRVRQALKQTPKATQPEKNQ